MPAGQPFTATVSDGDKVVWQEKFFTEDKNVRTLYFDFPISEIKRQSKPGLRRYVSYRDIPPVMNGLGIAVLSTSRGVMVDREARKQHLGGELLATVW